MNKRMPLILDTDPGMDDAIALLMLLGNPAIDLLAVTCVGGNVGLRNTLTNALALLELADRTDVPVYAGAAAPLLARLVTAEDIHGPSGLGTLQLPDPVTQPAAGDVSELFYQRASEQPGELTLLAVGPLTNLGKAFLTYPDLPRLLKQVVIMGGSVVGGNATLQAEFNIYVDPEAARVVFQSGVPLTVIPLDICHETVMRPADIARVEALGGACASAVGQLLRYSHSVATSRLKLDGAPVYDAVAAACLMRPELFTLAPFNVEIELHGKKTRGRTVVDHYGFTKKQPNCLIPVASNPTGYLDLMCECLSTLP